LGQEGRHVVAVCLALSYAGGCLTLAISPKRAETALTTLGDWIQVDRSSIHMSIPPSSAMALARGWLALAEDSE